MERVEIAAGRRLPKHKAAGLLLTVLRRNRLDWLQRKIPPDFYQETAWYLLRGEHDPDESPEEKREFSRAAARHFYKVARDYGFLRPGSDLPYLRAAIGFQDKRFEDESADEAEARISWQRPMAISQSSDFGDPFLRVASEEAKKEFLSRRLDLTKASVRARIRRYLAEESGCWKEEGGTTTYTWCALCHKPLRLVEATLDHIIPRARGGEDTLENLQLAHNLCNKLKGSLSPEEYRGEDPRFRRTRLKGIKLDWLAEVPLEDIMTVLGVSKATASRIRRRGWFVSEHPNRGRRKKGDMS